MTCSHGREGFCFDDASADDRTNFADAHRHAYTWATESAKLPHDEAEAYAAHYSEIEWRFDIDDWAWHPRAYAEWNH